MYRSLSDSSSLSNLLKFVNNFFYLFSNFFLIWWKTYCFAFVSLTACTWYHLRFELSTVFLIFLIIYRILFLIYTNLIFLVIAAYPSILYLYCHNCLSQTNDTHLFAVFHSRISTMNGIIICNCSEPSKISKNRYKMLAFFKLFLKFYLADTPHRRNA